jgi:hypothetical protein
MCGTSHGCGDIIERSELETIGMQVSEAFIAWNNAGSRVNDVLASIRSRDTDHEESVSSRTPTLVLGDPLSNPDM